MKKKQSWDEESLNFEVPGAADTTDQHEEFLSDSDYREAEALPEFAEEKPGYPTDMVSVKLLNTDEFGGKYVVVDENGDGYLVPKNAVKYTVKPQSIVKRALEIAEKPYNWDTEIDSIAISREEIREAMWREGFVHQFDQNNEEILRKLVSKLVSRGKLPIIKERG